MLVLCGSSISNYYNKVKLALLEKGVDVQRGNVATGGRDEAVLGASPLAKIPFLRTEPARCARARRSSSTSRRPIRSRRCCRATRSPPPRCASWRSTSTCTWSWWRASCIRRRSSAAASATATRRGSARLLERNIAAFKRLARFAPYVAGDQFTQADCAAWNSLPLVSMATQADLRRGPARCRRHRLEGLQPAGRRAAERAEGGRRPQGGAGEAGAEALRRRPPANGQAGADPGPAARPGRSSGRRCCQLGASLPCGSG